MIFVRLFNPQSRHEVLVNLAAANLIEVQYVTREGKAIDAMTAKADPTTVRIFVFKVDGVLFHIRSTDEHHGAAYLRKLYDEAVG